MVQQVYTHNNQGTGIFLHNATGYTYNNVTVRFCISVNDGGTQHGGISNATDGGAQTGIAIYNNTIYGYLGIINQALSVVTATVANNLLISETDTGYPFVNLDQTDSTYTLTGNDYYGNGTWLWSGTTYTTFAAWQSATGQEKIGGVNVGLTKSPQAVTYGYSGAISGYVPASLTQYQLQTASPLIGAGVNLHDAVRHQPRGCDGLLRRGGFCGFASCRRRPGGDVERRRLGHERTCLQLLRHCNGHEQYQPAALQRAH